MPSEKRARQRAGREAKMAEIAKAEQRKRTIRNGIILAVVAVVVIGGLYLIFGRSAKKTPTAASTTTSSTATSSTTSSTAAPSSPTISATEAKSLQDSANAAATAAGCPASTSTKVNTLTWKSAPPMTVDPTKTYTATVKTTTGDFVITLNPKAAPQTVNNFVFLAEHDYYKCVIFHRVIPGFMDQTGDPTGTGTGGPGYTIPDENPAKAADASNQYPVGSVAMANTGQPHSGGSQFFIVTGSEGQSLPNSYALFGTVTSGMDVVQKINQQGSAQGVPPTVTQRMLSVTINAS